MVGHEVYSAETEHSKVSVIVCFILCPIGRDGIERERINLVFPSSRWE